MRQPLVHLAVGSAAVCLGTWVALLAAGNTGLQWSISRGASTLFEQPLVVVLVAATGFLISYVCARQLHLAAVPLLVGVLVGDAVAGLILAPIAVGELEPIHAGLVFAAVAVLGVQPASALAGAAIASRRSHVT